MKIRFARQCFMGERVIKTEPEMSNRVTEEWYRRSHLYTGRALTADTLNCNIKHHIRHLQLFGRHLSRGIIHGLELTHYVQSYFDGGEEKSEQWLRLTAGIGNAHGGDDVSLPDTTDIKLEHVYQPGSQDLPRGVGIFVLEPLEIIDEIAPDENNQCQWDRERDPLSDEQIIDGCRLVFFPWPKEILGQVPPVLDKHFRNQLVYQIFDYELQHFKEKFKLTNRALDDLKEDKDLKSIAKGNELKTLIELLENLKDQLFFNKKGFEIALIKAIGKNRTQKYQLLIQKYAQQIKYYYEPLPWERLGVPLGLSYITNAGKIEFIDQCAVTRQGGAPLASNQVLQMNGTPFLWEARIRQFIGQLYDISQKTDQLPPAHSHFEVLPPVGVLPKNTINFDDMSTKFFPSQFIIDAVPVPEEQLEVVMNASAGLRSFDLHRPEKIKLLVPVPQAVFEPDLLKKEVPDPIFLETLRKLIRQIRLWLANRIFLRAMAQRVIGAIDFGQIPVFTQDMDAIPDEKKFMVPVKRDEGITEFDKRAIDAINKLHEWIKDHTNVSDKDIVQLVIRNIRQLRFHRDFKGLEPFIRDLEKKIEQTEDSLNTGYVKAETDMYRLRQLLLGNTKASRLATSPAMGMIVGGEETVPSIKDVESYFNTAVKIQPEVAAPEYEGISSRRLTPVMMTPQKMVGKSEDERIAHAMSIMKKREGGRKLATRDLLFAASTVASVLAERVGDGSKAVSMVAQPDNVKFTDGDRYELKPGFTPALGKYRTPLTTLRKFGVTRDKSVVERIYESPAMEIKSNTVQTKSSVFDSLAKIPLDIDEEVAVVSSDYAILSIDKFKAILSGFSPPNVQPKKVMNDRNRAGEKDKVAVFSIAPLTEEEKKIVTNKKHQAELEAVFTAHKGKNRLSSKDENLGNYLRKGLLDPDPTDGDEANYFSAGVTALEHGLEALRTYDRKLDDYKKALKQCKKVLIDLQANAKSWKDTLHEADDKLVVLRHDALVTRSLYEEEKVRIKMINEQRRAILDNHATTLVFVRPRLVDSRLDAPSIKLYGEYVNPVPACLTEDFEATAELEEMLDVFREVPISWLKDAKPLVRLVDHPGKIVDIFQHASNRTYQMVGSLSNVPQKAHQAYNLNEFGNAVNTILYAHQEYKQTFFEQKAKVDFSQFSTKTWRGLVQQAETDLSLADLIEAGKGNSALAHKATIVMENIEDVAVCLYHRCNELEPAIKLKWANLISVYDEPVDLRHLEILPAWEKIDFVFRRDLQNMVDWLFSQVETDMAQARQTMNDLVRVCILLASHAPVSTIIRGYVDEPSTGKIGDYLDIVVNKGQVRVGMVAAVFADEEVAVQGVVEDVSEEAARVKVMLVTGGIQNFNVGKGTPVKFLTSKILKVQI